jgi:beta-lactamase class A
VADVTLDSTKPSTVVAGFVPVASPIRYVRSYSHSLSGLQAYVAYATSTQNVRIVVQELDGNGWGASGRADESIPSASTYKLYVMMRVFDEINAGRLTWDSPMLDTTAGGCFERTIVVSTNPCAEEWIRQFDRTTLTNYVHDKGFSNGTGFTFSDATHTTAGDLARYLIGLNNGTLITGNNRTMLLEKMGRQLYRGGIPTGVPDARVEDKVGFLWDYIHDAAIVHKPQGTYVLVVMTKGYSYGYIANVARQIDDILYP